MPRLEHTIFVKAPRQRVFDLSRSVELHILSTSKTKERAVGGRTSGLLAADDEITWEAKHFGVRQRLTTRITCFDPPSSFTDIMVRGIFQRFEHTHCFREGEEGTEISEVFDYTAPLGPLGRLADVLFLERYMNTFLSARLAVIKKVAESADWQSFL